MLDTALSNALASTIRAAKDGLATKHKNTLGCNALGAVLFTTFDTSQRMPNLSPFMAILRLLFGMISNKQTLREHTS